jgi:hypothetical protein
VRGKVADCMIGEKKSELDAFEDEIGNDWREEN